MARGERGDQKEEGQGSLAPGGVTGRWEGPGTALERYSVDVQWEAGKVPWVKSVVWASWEETSGWCKEG